MSPVSFISRSLIIISFLLVVVSLQAQQERQYTQFFSNKLAINPAYAGEDRIGSITAIYRNQWLQFEGAPISQLITLNTPLFTPKVGFGLGLYHNTIGIFETYEASMAYSYDLINRPKHSLRIGIQGSLRNFKIDVNSPLIYTIDPNDPSLANVEPSKIYGNVGMGIYLNINKFYVGFSTPRFFDNTIGFNSISDLTAKEVAHYYIMTGLTLPISSDVDVQTNILGKYVKGAPFVMDINGNLIFSQTFTIGLGYRTGGDSYGDAMDLNVQYLFNKLIGFGVAYDYTLSKINKVSSGTVEALVRINFNNNKDNLHNPRFFF
ncbi:MAG TPA: PorP/SprF family type IX secretion system membrane protein [Saprospiraceae bacterium]|nr:PorP/SprF family type IX secretion system membrane protein [Saprospiraceae bacterium]